MRVVHIITRLILGGAQENTLSTVEGLMAAGGFEVSLVTGPPEGPEGQLVDRALAHGVDLVMMDELVRPVSPRRDAVALAELVAYLRRERPTIVHTHSAKAGILGRIAARVVGVPIIVHTIHGLPFHPTQSRWVYGTYVWMERLTARWCAKIISVADAMTAQALAAGIGRPEQFVTIRSGMDVDAFVRAGERRAAVRAELGIGADEFVIGKVARLFELKGHEYLLAAMPEVAAAVPEARLLLVGDGLLRGTLEVEARRLGVAERVTFAGLVPPERIPDLIGAMDVAVHCSLREGLARVLPQALIAGRPVISYDVDGAREVVLDGVTGRLLPPGEVVGLAEAIIELARDPALGRRMGEEGRRRFLDEFRTATMVGRITDLYRRLCGEIGGQHKMAESFTVPVSPGVPLAGARGSAGRR